MNAIYRLFEIIPYKNIFLLEGSLGEIEISIKIEIFPSQRGTDAGICNCGPDFMGVNSV